MNEPISYPSNPEMRGTVPVQFFEADENAPPPGTKATPRPPDRPRELPSRPAVVEPESYLQKLRAKELSDRLDRGLAADSPSEAKPLAIQNEPLLDAIKRISHEFDLPMALDARAMQRKQLDPQATVSGRIDPGNLRNSLKRMLAPLGLTVEVQHEVIFVTPMSKG
jgi:hypothetical protein